VRLRGIVVPGADQLPGSRERDKLTIAEVRAYLGISRRTFYEWRAKGRAPRCITLPNGSLRIRRSEYQRWLAAREESRLMSEGTTYDARVYRTEVYKGSAVTTYKVRRAEMIGGLIAEALGTNGADLQACWSQSCSHGQRKRPSANAWMRRFTW
jgi:excisionase family DNA binding protein